METITTEELKEKKDNGDDFRLINVLGRDSYRERHIPGSEHLYIDELERMAPKRFDKGEELVVYCASTGCLSSGQAAELLRNLGFRNVRDYKAGIRGWQEANYELHSIA